MLADATVVIATGGVILCVIAVLVAVMIASGSRGGRDAAAPSTEVVPAALSTTLSALAAGGDTCRVRVSMAGRNVDLFVRDGRLYHATSRSTTGDEAAAEALRWDETQTEVAVTRNIPQPTQQNVTMTLGQLSAAAGVRNQA